MSLSTKPETLLAHFDRLAEAPDAVPRLRRFILDLAVRGKLVEQNPDDEPASELLKRIKSRQAPAVIDVRSGFEFRTGHIPGAIHAPTWKILLRLVRIPSDKNAELVVTCEHGPRDSLPRDCSVPSVTGM